MVFVFRGFWERICGEENIVEGFLRIDWGDVIWVREGDLLCYWEWNSIGFLRKVGDV